MVKKEGKKTMSKIEIEEALINNFTNLQKVLTNLSVKFDELSSKISKLLELFEISAKSFAEKYPQGDSKSGIDKDFLKKLDSLLDQNKTISKAITMMEGKIRGKTNISKSPERFSLRPNPLPKY